MIIKANCQLVTTGNGYVQVHCKKKSSNQKMALKSNANRSEKNDDNHYRIRVCSAVAFLQEKREEKEEGALPHLSEME